MKLLHITFQNQYTDTIAGILSRHELCEYTVHIRTEGHDRDGKHNGSKAFPGHLAVIHVQTPDDKVDEVFEDLRNFQQESKAHQHLEALVLPVEKRLNGEG